MSYLGSWKVDDLLTFPANTHTAATGAATDGDAVPAYRVYEDETGTAILTGNMAKLDDANTTGFYSEQITLSAANGFEKGKCYTIYISVAVGSVTGTMAHTFQMEAEVDANVVSDKTGYGLAANAVNTTSIQDGAITAAKIADGAIDAATFAANAITDAVVASDVTIASVTGAVGSVAGAVASVTAGVTVTTNNDKTGYGLSAAAVQAIWDALTSALTSVGSIGKLIVDNLNATISSRATPAQVNAEADTALADVGLTTTITGRIDAAITTRASQTSVDDLPTNAELATSQAAADDATLAAIAALNNLSAAQVNTEVDTALADYDAPTFAELDARTDAIDSVLVTIAGYLDTEVAATLAAVDTEVAAIKAKTDLIPAAPAATGDIPTVADILAAVIEGSVTLKGALRLTLAALAGKVTGGGTATVIFRDVADAKARITATVDSSGNRTAITRDITD